MNFELTTKNLQQSCRLCLNKGDVDIWQHQVTLPRVDIDDEMEDTDENIECTAFNLFEIFENYDDIFFGLNQDLRLLCFACLNELTSCFMFYEKARHINKQIQSLYKEAQKNETEQQLSLEGDVEVLEVENAIQCTNETEREDIGSSHNDANEKNLEDTENRLHDSNEDELEYILTKEQSDLVEQAEIIPESHINLLRDSKLVEEDESESMYIDMGEELLETCAEYEEANEIGQNASNSENIIEDYTEVSNPGSRIMRDKATRGHSIPMLLPHENSSLVVTQFIPATAHVVLEDTSSQGNEEEYDNDGLKIVHTQDLNTVDYAAVEIKSSNLQEIFKADSQISGRTSSKGEHDPTLDIYGSEDQIEEKDDTFYVCKYCPQAFAASHYLIAHVRKSHVCKYCTQAFVKTTDLYVHIRQAHHQHKCAICNKELSSHSNLRGHIKRVHGIRLPAQVALLDYRPPSDTPEDNKQNKGTDKQVDNQQLDEMDIYF